MAVARIQDASADAYVGTLVGESTSSEFRLAVAHESIREQDLIAVNAELRPSVPGTATERVRVWAKVQRIERLNPLFPAQAGHELAATRTDPLETVLSLSREMVTAVCRILGAEPLDGSPSGKLEQLRYPPQPASSAYRPDARSITRMAMGDLAGNQRRALDVATLANRLDVPVWIDGHAIVTRHLAILAMTGAGKSWAARRIIEQLARKNYPIVIFDPHGDYTGLADVPGLKGRVRRYYGQLPLLDEPVDKAIAVVESLSSWPLSNSQRSLFEQMFPAAHAFLGGSEAEMAERTGWLSDYLGKESIRRFSIRPDLYLLADLTEAVVRAGKAGDAEALHQLREWTSQDLKLSKQQSTWTEGLIGRLRTAARALRRMEDISRTRSQEALPLPRDRTQLVRYGGISIITLAGYTSDFQATIYSLVAEDLFEARVRERLKLPLLLLLEEAHTFVPGTAGTQAERQSISTTRQIAQEGRKFGIGLILISQRPSRLDATTLSQCNSHLVMRMVNPADQSFVRQVVETLGEDETRLLPDLDVGEAILSGQVTNFPVLVRMKEPESRGEREERDAFERLEEAHADQAGRSPSFPRLPERNGS
jgi:DNA helicase HerA-like ATPase